MSYHSCERVFFHQCTNCIFILLTRFSTKTLILLKSPSEKYGQGKYVGKTLKCNCSCCSPECCCLCFSVLGSGTGHSSALLTLKSLRVHGKQEPTSVAHE